MRRIRVCSPRTSEPAAGSVSANAACSSPLQSFGTSSRFRSSEAPATIARLDRSVPVMIDAAVLQTRPSSSMTRMRSAWRASVPP